MTKRVRVNVRALANTKAAESVVKVSIESGIQHRSREMANRDLTRSLFLELESARAASNAAAFAYGGIFPGIIHSHGKLHESHRVSYSVGVAGQYLLHVRLRKQGSALPGSPFVLTVVANVAHSLSGPLPDVIHGEVCLAYAMPAQHVHAWIRLPW